MSSFQAFRLIHTAHTIVTVVFVRRVQIFLLYLEGQSITQLNTQTGKQTDRRRLHGICNWRNCFTRLLLQHSHLSV